MTHSLHRQGTRENLQHDFALLCMPEIGYNHINSPEKARRFLEIIKPYHPDNYGVITLGNKYTHDDEEIKKALDTAPAIFCVINHKEDLVNIFKELRKEDLGLCVVVNGIYEIIEECCQKAGLQPHTTNHSLGVWGKTEKLPDAPALEIITMCGHGQVSANLVLDLVEKVKNKKISLREAVVTMAKPCVCGFFNTRRAEEILRNYLKV